MRRLKLLGVAVIAGLAFAGPLKDSAETSPLPRQDPVTIRFEQLPVPPSSSVEYRIMPNTGKTRIKLNQPVKSKRARADNRTD